MAAAAPFGSEQELLRASDEIWWKLDAEDWLEAFRAHPKIGERSTSALSQQEQAGTATATSEQFAELERLNGEYEKRFGYIFIIRAAGRTTEEMLQALRQRLSNSPEVEIRVAAEQQNQITRLRLK